MFKIEATCEDNKVHLVLRALVGLIHPNPTVVPVSNAVHANGKLHAETNGDLLEQFVLHCKKKKLTVITPKEMIAWMPTVGRSPKSYSNLLTRATEAHILKKAPGSNGNRGVRYNISLAAGAKR
jgi:hypothetical protein